MSEKISLDSSAQNYEIKNQIKEYSIRKNS